MCAIRILRIFQWRKNQLFLHREDRNHLLAVNSHNSGQIIDVTFHTFGDRYYLTRFLSNFKVIIFDISLIFLLTVPLEWREYLGGWGAAVINIFVTFPVNKTVFRQVVHGISMTDALHQLKKEGYFYIYRGVMPPLLQKSLSSALMFGTYSHFQRIITDSFGSYSSQVSVNFTFISFMHLPSKIYDFWQIVHQRDELPSLNSSLRGLMFCVNETFQISERYCSQMRKKDLKGFFKSHVYANLTLKALLHLHDILPFIVMN